MFRIWTVFSIGIAVFAVSSSCIALVAQSRTQAPKPQLAVSPAGQTVQASTPKHSLIHRKPHPSTAPVARPIPVQEEQSQPSEQAQSRAWLQDAASRVQAPDAATLREEMRQSERLRQQLHGEQFRDRVAPQSRQSPQRSIPNGAIAQAGQI